MEESNEMNLISHIFYLGQLAIVACDRRCDKAWGVNSRPKVQLSDDEDDYEILSDDELGIAPADPGSYEGQDGKPTDRRHNKWCVRECERSVLLFTKALTSTGVSTGDELNLELSDFTTRQRNRPDR